jgi:hypothetical protein
MENILSYGIAQKRLMASRLIRSENQTSSKTTKKLQPCLRVLCGPRGLQFWFRLARVGRNLLLVLVECMENFQKGLE